MTIRIVFVTSHPIQYQAPVFRLLANDEEIEFSVLFAMLPNAAEQGTGYGVEFEWDIPLLEGYHYEVLDNVSDNPGVSWFSGCDTPGVKDRLKAIQPDVVIVNGWVVKTCLQTLWACKRLNIPCLVRGEANDLCERAWWKRQLQGILVRQYDACLCIGKANKAFYEARGVASNRLFPAPYGIENQRFQQAAQSMISERNTLRDNWGVPAESTCFLYCGKFEDKKHPVDLIESFAKARAQEKNIHLLMVGDGALRPQCEELVRRKDLPVTFAGFLNQSKIVAAYVAADCLVLPSNARETWGLVVNEAMACGLPAIVSDQVGCAADLVVSGETGDVFPYGDWSELAEKMRRFGQAGSSIAAMGKKARERVQAYSPQAVADGIIKAAGSVTGREQAG